eukprot:1613671-Pyramimonas_sp.AAC.1
MHPCPGSCTRKRRVKGEACGQGARKSGRSDMAREANDDDDESQGLRAAGPGRKGREPWARRSGRSELAMGRTTPNHALPRS